MGLGTLRSWTEEQRIAFLLACCRRTAPLADRRAAGRRRAVADVLDTFRMIAALPPESLGAYVITMARASDVLAVELLQREAGCPTRCAWCRCSKRRATCAPPRT